MLLSSILRDDLHLESTVGCINEGRIADLSQDQQGTHLMALGNTTHHKVREDRLHDILLDLEWELVKVKG